jgi:hypothetical protein
MNIPLQVQFRFISSCYIEWALARANHRFCTDAKSVPPPPPPLAWEVYLLPNRSSPISSREVSGSSHLGGGLELFWTALEGWVCQVFEGSRFLSSKNQSKYKQG